MSLIVHPKENESKRVFLFIAVTARLTGFKHTVQYHPNIRYVTERQKQLKYLEK